MEGRARAAQQDYELALAQAWHTEVFARQKKLKALKDYLPRKAEPMTGEQMMAVLRALKDGGAPMDIRKLN